METSNGWELLFHTAFLDALNRQKIAARESEGNKLPDEKYSLEMKVLRSMYAQVFEVVPRNPGDPSFRLGTSLGPNFKHWLRSKFREQYRIFFRYSSKSGVIVYAWANDKNSLRAYESKSDAYLVFRKMLEAGKVPNSWDELVAEAKKLS